MHRRNRAFDLIAATIFAFVVRWLEARGSETLDTPSIATVVNILPSKHQKILLVSLDGFRWDLHQISHTPSIDRVINNGVTVDHVLNVFPTKTLPNHQSIVTGLYAEHHGMVDNAFMDKKTGLIFDLENQKCMNDSSWWKQSFPIWVELQRKTKYKSGNLFWPGFEVPYGKNNETAKYLPSPKLRKSYNGIGKNSLSESFQIAKEALELLKKDDVSFVSMYSTDPDLTLHENGVESQQAKKVVQKIDHFVGAIYKGVTNSDELKDKVNVIFIGTYNVIITITQWAKSPKKQSVRVYF